MQLSKLIIEMKIVRMSFRIQACQILSTSRIDLTNQTMIIMRIRIYGSSKTVKRWTYTHQAYQLLHHHSRDQTSPFTNNSHWEIKLCIQQATATGNAEKFMTRDDESTGYISIWTTTARQQPHTNAANQICTQEQRRSWHPHEVAQHQEHGAWQQQT